MPVHASPGAGEEPTTVLRSPASVRLLIELAGEHGVTPAACLAGTGLVLGHLAHAEAELTGDQELTVIRNLVGALPEAPGLGLMAGARYHLTTHGIWGFALVSSPNLRSAINFGLRYLDLTFAFNRISLQERDGEAIMILDDTGVPPDLRRFLIEREGASIMTLQRDMFSAAIPLKRLESTYPEPPYADLYEEVFGIRARFGAPANLATFDAAVLDLPLPQANELTAQQCEEQCRALLERRTKRGGVARQVRNCLIPASGNIPTLEQVARGLHVSPRTLRRQLAQEGTSFRSLVTEVRLTLAEEYLSGGAMPVGEVATRLGYSDASSFTRAFTRQHGLPPGAFRRTYA